MSKEYILTRVDEDTVTLEDVAEKTSKDYSFEELTSIAVDNLVIGFNRVTGKLKVSTIQDYVNYKVSKAKLSGIELNISYDVTTKTAYGGMIGTNATYIVEGNCLRVTVAESEEIRTDGVLVVSPTVSSENKIKHIIYDIPTYCYNYIYFFTSKLFYIESISFTERCTFEDVKGISQFLRSFPLLKNADMSNLNFDSVTDFEDFFNWTNTDESYETNIVFPELTTNNTSGTVIKVYNAMQMSILNYSALKFLSSMLANEVTMGTNLELDTHYYMLQISEENYVGYLKLYERVLDRIVNCLKVSYHVTEDKAYKMIYIGKLIVPYTEDIINNLDLRSVFTVDKSYVNEIIIDMTKGKIEFPTEALSVYLKVLHLESDCITIMKKANLFLYYRNVPVRPSEDILNSIIETEDKEKGIITNGTVKDLHYFDDFIDNTMLDKVADKGVNPLIRIEATPENLLVAMYMLSSYVMKGYPKDRIKIQLTVPTEIADKAKEYKNKGINIVEIIKMLGDVKIKCITE